MDELLTNYRKKLTSVNRNFERYLVSQLDLSNRLIAIKGARGTGKTTLLLQLAKYHLSTDKTLYVSLDHMYFYDKTLYQLAQNFELYGGKYLLLDEVHKYPNWSREIKLIYDDLPQLKVIFTSSSLLRIHQAESDLSRRAVSYQLKELSFREFIALETGIRLSAYPLGELLADHSSIATELLEKIKPLVLFKKYLEIGAYPYFKESEEFYKQKLLNTINLSIETDINAVETLNFTTLVKLKKLLASVASSVPFTPNISKLSNQIGLTRNMLVYTLKLLSRAGLIQELYKASSGIGQLTKPEKIYLNNPNLIYALAPQNSQLGNIRETFFIHQFMDLYPIHLSKQADFLVDRRYTFEVGGRSKTHQQIRGLSDAYIAKDDIEIGYGNVIPLWLFGFMY